MVDFTYNFLDHFLINVFYIKLIISQNKIVNINSRDLIEPNTINTIKIETQL